MKKLFDFFYTSVTPILTVILVIGFFYILNQNCIQANRIDTLNKTLYDVAAHKHEIYKEIQQTQFKEDYYLNQLSNSTSLIMTMIAIVVTLGGFITYKSFNDKVKNSEEKLENQIRKSSEIEELLKTQLDESIKSAAEIKNTYNKFIISNIYESQKIIMGKLIKFHETKTISRHDIYFMVNAFNKIVESYYILTFNTINNAEKTNNNNNNNNLKTIKLNRITSHTLKFFEKTKPRINQIKHLLTTEHKTLFKTNLKVIDEIPVEIINQFKEIGKLLTDEDIDIITEY